MWKQFMVSEFVMLTYLRLNWEDKLSWFNITANYLISSVKVPVAKHHKVLKFE